MTVKDEITSVFVPLLGDFFAKEVAVKLQEAIGDGKDWRKSALLLIMDTVTKEGLAGLTTAADTLRRMANGEVSEIDWTDLETASNILAAMQNAETEQKKELEKFLTIVGQALGIICVAAIKVVL